MRILVLLHALCCTLACLGLAADETEIAETIRSTGATVFLKQQRIVEVSANRSHITDEHLAALAPCTEVTDLSLEGTGITAKGIAHLSGLTKLEWLNLYGCKVGDAGLAQIAKLPKLAHLPIGENGITDAGLKTLAGNKQLLYLGLRANPIKNEGLTHLAGLTRLKQLHLGETKITRLDALRALKQLEKLWIGDLDLEPGELDRFRADHPGCVIVNE